MSNQQQTALSGRAIGLAIVGIFLTALSATSPAAAEIPWKNSPEAALNAARSEGKPILVFVTAEWCHYCKKMKKDTWSDRTASSVVAANFQTLMLDGDRDKAVVKKLGLNGYPATLIYTPDGEFVTQKSGYMSPQQTLAWLASIAPR
ncbi:thioredoxin family protein [Crateriforma spongiae]|uniref:thioredoxin family protein n=1 Tax=Crateriforma spongiae TaxID=2724528 RepID=UPI0014467F0C|nr:thioredoxin family protein [Crateriforma spongiae]